MATDLWLGLDAGTTAVKAAAYTADGRQTAQAEAPSEVRRLPDGGREQDMEQVWDAAAAVLAEVAKQCGGQRIAALGVCGQGDGLWAVDGRGSPVAPAMLWSDTRAAADLDALEADGAAEAVARGCHTSLWPGVSALLWRWMRREKPDAAERTAHACTCPDWIGHRLTGRAATDYANASIPFMDFASRAYGQAQAAALGCEDLLDRLPPCFPAATKLGGVTAEAAARTGLAEGLPVSVGTLDIAAMVAGMGMERAGETLVILGTTAVMAVLADPSSPRRAPVGACVLHPASETAIRVLAPTAGTAAIDWYARTRPAGADGDRPGNTAADIAALAAAAPPGASGVTFLPYLSGERAPFVAPNLRASFHGLSEVTTPADMARAVMEGTALSLRHCFEAEGGLPGEPVRITGGGARSAVWRQIVADALGQTVVASERTDHGLWGAACIGAAAAGHGDPMRLARRDEKADEQAPDPASARAYDGVFARYRALSRSQRALLDKEETGA